MKPITTHPFVPCCDGDNEAHCWYHCGQPESAHAKAETPQERCTPTNINDCSCGCHRVGDGGHWEGACNCPTASSFQEEAASEPKADRLSEAVRALIADYLRPCDHPGSTLLDDPGDEEGVPCAACGERRVRAALESVVRECAEAAEECPTYDVGDHAAWLLEHFGLEDHDGR